MMPPTRRQFMQGAGALLASALALPRWSFAARPDSPVGLPGPARSLRVIAYVDGFDLRAGLAARGWQRYQWLNVRALAEHLLKPGQALAATKYFDAPLSGPADVRTPQTTFVEALGTLSGVQLFRGRHAAQAQPAGNPGSRLGASDAKTTDVSLAVELLRDALQDRFDAALLISADADLCPAIAACREACPGKRIVVAFPPHRSSGALRRAAHAYLYIGRDKLARSVLPAQVRRGDGYLLNRPASW